MTISSSPLHNSERTNCGRRGYWVAGDWIMCSMKVNIQIHPTILRFMTGDTDTGETAQSQVYCHLVLGRGALGQTPAPHLFRSVKVKCMPGQLLHVQPTNTSTNKHGLEMSMYACFLLQNTNDFETVGEQFMSERFTCVEHPLHSESGTTAFILLYKQQLWLTAVR